MIKSDGMGNNAISIIDTNIEKIALIESERKLQNTHLKNGVLSATKSHVDDIKGNEKQLEETIKENSGLLNFIRRLFVEVKEFLSCPSEQSETQKNLALSGNSIKSMNNQLVKISILNRDKNLGSAEKSDGSVLNKVGYEKQDIVAIENEDNADKVSR